MNWKQGIAMMCLGAMLGGAATFEANAGHNEKNLQQIYARDNEIWELKANLDMARSDSAEQIRVRQSMAQSEMLTLVKLNACQVAAQQLAAQPTNANPPQTQQIVAALLKAFLR